MEIIRSVITGEIGGKSEEIERRKRKREERMFRALSRVFLQGEEVEVELGAWVLEDRMGKCLSWCS